jgi:hypothetical protein
MKREGENMGFRGAIFDVDGVQVGAVSFEAEALGPGFRAGKSLKETV